MYMEVGAILDYNLPTMHFIYAVLQITHKNSELQLYQEILIMKYNTFLKSIQSVKLRTP